jgi:hypothetical protein
LACAGCIHFYEPTVPHVAQSETGTAEVTGVFSYSPGFKWSAPTLLGIDLRFNGPIAVGGAWLSAGGVCGSGTASYLVSNEAEGTTLRFWSKEIREQHLLEQQPAVLSLRLISRDLAHDFGCVQIPLNATRQTEWRDEPHALIGAWFEGFRLFDALAATDSIVAGGLRAGIWHGNLRLLLQAGAGAAGQYPLRSETHYVALPTTLRAEHWLVQSGMFALGGALSFDAVPLVSTDSHLGDALLFGPRASLKLALVSGKLPWLGFEGRPDGASFSLEVAGGVWFEGTNAAPLITFGMTSDFGFGR